jgi:hypothetical protein
MLRTLCRRLSESGKWDTMWRTAASQGCEASLRTERLGDLFVCGGILVGILHRAPHRHAIAADVVREGRDATEAMRPTKLAQIRTCNFSVIDFPALFH